MFEGFALERMDVGEAELRVRHGGSGPPVLLLHGHPRTHATWHRVAALLAPRHTVVCPDLRGYGESSKPRTTEDHEPYSKRAMSRDCVTLMRALGHDRFAVCGHDRGAAVAYRLALDHPDAVERRSSWTGFRSPSGSTAPTGASPSFGGHWFFFGQTSKPAERYISADPDAWYDATPEHMGEEAFADFRRAIHDPQTVHAMMEDYRAGLGIDRQHDEADRAAGRRIACPTLVLWATGDDMEDLYGDPLPIWEPWTTHLNGGRIQSGHHMAEEAPAELASALLQFLGPG